MTCARCGNENPEGSRFCNACSAPLAIELGAEVRKSVTVLFCDLVGFTSLGDRVDPERLRELMAGFHSELRAILEHHGGTVEKFAGDAVMAVFGVPRTHEDDALRAVRAAEEIRVAVGRLGLEARTGVNTGEVVTGAGETLVTGDAVNVAARLEQAADPGQTLIGATTYALVRGAVRAEPVEPLALKGKADPVPAYRLVELLPGGSTRDLSRQHPFVGRETELERLASLLLRATHERAPQLVTIVGPPGIGKSRLALELAGRSGSHAVVGRCLAYGEGITYWPLIEIAGQVGDPRSALRDDGDAELAAQRVAAALGSVEAVVSPEEVAWGFRKLFEGLARDVPLIVVLDDIQWAEPTLLDLIEYVAAFATDACLLVLCLARPDLLESRPSWVTPKPDASVVTLEPLSEAEGATLVDELGSLPRETRTRIVRAAEGNPFFMEQLVAMQADGGGGEARIPPTIQAVLAARLDLLDPGERAVLERASIEGRLFHRGAVQALLPAHARAGVGGHLMTLVRKELIRPDRARLPGDDGFRFAHVLIRDAAYESLPKRLRGELHGRLADWLESRTGEASSEEILGHHLERAHDYLVELSPEDRQAPALALRAGRLLGAAGRHAHAHGDDGAARALLGRATRLLPETDADLPRLLALLGSSLYEGGDAVAALAALERARARAAAAGQRGVEIRARMDGLAISRGPGTGEGSDAALVEAEACIAELEGLDDAESLTRVWRAVMEIGFLRSDFTLVGEASGHLLECARRAGIRREEVWAVRGLASALTYGPTPVADAIVRVERGVADFPVERAGEDHLALLYAFAGREEEAREAMGRSRRVREELGQELDLAGLCLDATWIELLAGRPDRAEQELLAAIQVLERAGAKDYLASETASMAEVLYRLGRDEEAESWTRRSEEAASLEDVEAQAWWRSVRAKILARRGEAAEATRLSVEAVAWVQRGDNAQAIGDCLADRAEVLLLLGRVDEARPALEKALETYERKGIVPSIRRMRALLAPP